MNILAWALPATPTTFRNSANMIRQYAPPRLIPRCSLLKSTQDVTLQPSMNIIPPTVQTTSYTSPACPSVPKQGATPTPGLVCLPIKTSLHVASSPPEMPRNDCNIPPNVQPVSKPSPVYPSIVHYDAPPKQGAQNVPVRCTSLNKCLSVQTGTEYPTSVQATANPGPACRLQPSLVQHATVCPYFAIVSLPVISDPASRPHPIQGHCVRKPSKIPQVPPPCPVCPKINIPPSRQPWQQGVVGGAMFTKGGAAESKDEGRVKEGC